MIDTGVPMLSLVLLLPLAGALVVALLPRRDVVLRTAGFAFTMATFGISLAIFAMFRTGVAGFQFVENVAWIPRFGIGYRLGVDGISLFLVLLTTFLLPLCLLATFPGRRTKEYVVALLLSEWSILGVFLSLDLVLFYIFWEVGLIPMYLLIGIWGYERRVYATVKFFLYTLVGGLLMLVAIVVLYLQTGGDSFSYAELLRRAPDLALGTQRWLFAAFAIAFAVKVPVFPLHTWLPDAHTEAPTTGSVILAGLLLKLGAYGFIRIAIPTFGEIAAGAAPYLLAAGVVGVLYGAAVSVVQRDLKRLVAYSSVSHLGFIMVGLFAFTTTAASGATLQMVNHGLSTGALFFLVGMLYERRHTRQIADFGGLSSVVPLLSGVFLIVALSSLGLPGLNGFVGEFLILIGTFEVNRLAAVLATAGVVGAALYLLWAYQRTFHGPVTADANRAMKDLDWRERFILYPMLALIVLIGVWPQPFLSRIEPSVQLVVERIAGAK